MITKFDSEKHLQDFRHLPFSYYSSEVMLDFAGYLFSRNGENVLVWQDALYPHDFPAIFLPQNKKNWEKMTIFAATQEDVDAVKQENIGLIIEKPVTTEFFYTTETFLHPTGSFRKEVNSFRNKYPHTISHVYPLQEVETFYDFWWNQRERTSFTADPEYAFFRFLLGNLDKYKVRQIYIEIDGRLVGFAWGVPHWKGNWASVQLKVDYRYRGLEKFLRHEYVKLFSEFELFTTGGSTPEEGIARHKRQLGPCEERQYWYLFTGERTVE